MSEFKIDDCVNIRHYPASRVKIITEAIRADGDVDDWYGVDNNGRTQFYSTSSLQLVPIVWTEQQVTKLFEIEDWAEFIAFTHGLKWEVKA